MPYGKGDPLPPSAKNLSMAQRRIFRSAFNQCHKSGKPEEMCFKIAHAAAGKGGK
jgi:cation transport regulator ChaB